jgi:hypothetical protein
MPTSVPRIDTHRLYSRLTDTGRATGRLRLVEYPQIVQHNPYSIPIPERPQIILDVPCAASQVNQWREVRRSQSIGQP